jgi:ubiquinone/menaquinone biosynthesis C-methylase UbiE
MKFLEESFRSSEKYWHEKAATFAGLYKTTNPLQIPNRLFLRDRMRIVSRFVLPNPNGTAMDVGCGSGEFANELSSIYGRVVACDYSQIMLDIAKGQFGKPNIEFQIADSTRLPVPDGSVDALYALGLLDYVRDVRTTIGEFSRVLKSGGTCVITAPKSPSLYAPLRWSSTLRARLFGIPPIVHAFRKREIEDLITDCGLTPLESIPLWTTMWICHVRK